MLELTREQVHAVGQGGEEPTTSIDPLTQTA